MAPTINVNLKRCRPECLAPQHVSPPHGHVPDCPGAPIPLPCPIQRTVEMMVRLGTCECFHRGAKNAEPPPTWVHTESCPARHIRVTCSIGGETWGESEVAEVEPHHSNPGLPIIAVGPDSPAMVACRERWEIVKALVTGKPLGRRGADSVDAGIAIVELFAQRDVVFAALAAKVRAEQADDATTRGLVRLIPAVRVPDVARATAEDYLSAVALARYVSHLIATVGALT